MAYRYFKIDDATGRPKRLVALFVDTKYESAGQVDFTVLNMAADSLLDVYVNGLLQDEGISEDFVRDVGSNKITFNATVPNNAKVRIRLWS